MSAVALLDGAYSECSVFDDIVAQMCLKLLVLLTKKSESVNSYDFRASLCRCRAREPCLQIVHAECLS